MAVDKFRDLAAFGIAALLVGVLLIPFGISRIQGAESQPIRTAESRPIRTKEISSVELPRRPLTVGKSIPLVVHGIALGTAVVYNNPSTGKPSDYLEFYNPTGNLVAVVWFDRFGIRRTAVDRSFLHEKNQIEGVFVPVEDGELI
ncbi:MAG TPA: hypothetical protein VFY96_08010 [Candidatus Binatia bacterium]|nr:hypothetical protein [Candidatus Binatia bacterium]